MSDARPRPATAREIAATLCDAPLEEARELVGRYAEDPRAQVRQAVERTRRRIAREEAERERVLGMYALQEELAGGGVAVGVDEVGRGALAGPLTVAAVCLPPEPVIWGLNDSKQLSPARREALAAQVADVARAIGIAHVEPADIDRDGMAASLRRAMAAAVADTGLDPDAVLIDGNPVHAHPRERCLVKGDARVAAIAAASIVAKVTRDALMVALDEEWPGYHLAACKGYGSAEHIAAIRERGLTPAHRASFCGNFLETPRLF
ncbi:ribonuclease HII [Thermophilibacter sp.]